MRLSGSLLQQVGKQAYRPKRLKRVLNYAVFGFAATCCAYSGLLLFNLASGVFQYQSKRRPEIETQKRELEAAMQEKTAIERQAGLPAPLPMASLLRWLGDFVLSRLRPLGRRSPRPSRAASPPRPARPCRAALMMMYSGSGYAGMQRQPDRPTVEGALLDCLLAGGHINAGQFAQPRQQLGFVTASRTDSGVSALAQLVTLHHDLADPGALVRDLNSRLPDSFRVLDAVRVTKGFNSRYRVLNRTYAYYCPTFALCPDPLPSAYAYRIEPDRLRHLRYCLSRFPGTRNYFNFTCGRLLDDPSCARYIVNSWADEPFLYNGLEFVEIRIVGQSFMRHQIRKMIGLCIAVVRGQYEPSAFDAAFSAKRRLNVPRAPGLGLLLCDLNYAIYNREYAAKLGYPTLDWARFHRQRQ
uniref:tRNA pseudouridine synthase n=1 Tax=Macrostomum lignano TaxID=282301 RepID=A0A1I8G6Q1_9PLAT